MVILPCPALVVYGFETPLITINHPFLGAQNTASGPGVSSGTGALNIIPHSMYLIIYPIEIIT